MAAHGARAGADVIGGIMAKLGLPPAEDQHRRVLAVLICLGLTG